MAAADDLDPARAPEYPNSNARPRNKRIALVTRNRVDREALGYAFSACQRMDARLDILTNLPPEETHRVVIRVRGAADIPWRIVRVDGATDEDVFRYARNQSGLLFVVSGRGDASARKLWHKSRTDGIGPGVPWVVVESKQKQR